MVSHAESVRPAQKECSVDDVLVKSGLFTRSDPKIPNALVPTDKLRALCHSGFLHPEGSVRGTADWAIKEALEAAAKDILLEETAGITPSDSGRRNIVTIVNGKEGELDMDARERLRELTYNIVQAYRDLSKGRAPRQDQGRLFG